MFICRFWGVNHWLDYFYRFRTSCLVRIWQSCVTSWYQPSSLQIGQLEVDDGEFRCLFLPTCLMNSKSCQSTPPRSGIISASLKARRTVREHDKCHGMQRCRKGVRQVQPFYGWSWHEGSRGCPVEMVNFTLRSDYSPWHQCGMGKVNDSLLD